MAVIGHWVNDRWIPEPLPAPEKQKWCNPCGKMQPVSEFSKSRVQPDGYTRVCRKAKAAEGARSLQRHREGGAVRGKS